MTIPDHIAPLPPTLADQLAKVLPCHSDNTGLCHSGYGHATNCSANLRPAVLALLEAVRRETRRNAILDCLDEVADAQHRIRNLLEPRND